MALRKLSSFRLASKADAGDDTPDRDLKKKKSFIFGASDSSSSYAKLEDDIPPLSSLDSGTDANLQSTPPKHVEPTSALDRKKSLKSLTPGLSTLRSNLANNDRESTPSPRPNKSISFYGKDTIFESTTPITSDHSTNDPPITPKTSTLYERRKSLQSMKPSLSIANIDHQQSPKELSQKKSVQVLSSTGNQMHHQIMATGSADSMDSDNSVTDITNVDSPISWGLFPTTRSHGSSSSNVLADLNELPPRGSFRLPSPLSGSSPNVLLAYGATDAVTPTTSSPLASLSPSRRGSFRDVLTNEEGRTTPSAHLSRKRSTGRLLPPLPPQSHSSNAGNEVEEAEGGSHTPLRSIRSTSNVLEHRPPQARRSSQPDIGTAASGGGLSMSQLADLFSDGIQQLRSPGTTPVGGISSSSKASPKHFNFDIMNPVQETEEGVLLKDTEADSAIGRRSVLYELGSDLEEGDKGDMDSSPNSNKDLLSGLEDHNSSSETHSKSPSRITTKTKTISLAIIVTLLSTFAVLVARYHYQIAASTNGLLNQMNGNSYNNTEILSRFNAFINKYHRNYADGAEYALRLENFKNTLDRINTLNEEEGQDMFNVTKYADMSVTEVKKKLLGTDLSLADGVAVGEDVQLAPMMEVKLSELAATKSDWTGIYTTAVRDQGWCSSCWAFALAQELESSSIMFGLLTPASSSMLSTEQMVACSAVGNLCPDGTTSTCPSPTSYSFGCDGGNPYLAYNYVYSTGGLMSDSLYPYSSTTADGYTPSKCAVVPSDFVVTTTSIYKFGANAEAAMANYVLTTGPIIVTVDATNWPDYYTGVMTPAGCGIAVVTTVNGVSTTSYTYDINHSVQIVGVDMLNNYWIVRNSWGPDWGQSGFIFLKYGTDTCGLASSGYGMYIKATPAATSKPTSKPSSKPSSKPTSVPTRRPTVAPSKSPSPSRVSLAPSKSSSAPSKSSVPTRRPTVAPSKSPSPSRASLAPSKSSSAPSKSSVPTRRPTVAPSKSPSPSKSSSAPSKSSLVPTRRPTAAPTKGGTTTSPSRLPTRLPTRLPSK